MANQRGTFAKRQREQDRKDKARAKQERLAARRAQPNGTKGPQIAWDEAVVNTSDTSDDPPAPPPPVTPTDDVPSD
jgi:hypothetical protein